MHATVAGACRSTPALPGRHRRSAAAAPTPPGARDGAPDALFRRLAAPPEDRPRRGLHGRRLAGRPGHRPGRAADAVRGADGTAACPSRCCALRGLVDRGHPAQPAQHPRRARAATSARHYDLSNELFAAFLDPSMSLQLGAVRPGPPAGRAGAARGAAAQGRRHPRPGRRAARAAGCSRSAPAGASSRSAAARRGATVTTRDPLGRAARPGDEADRRGRRRRARRRAAAGLPRGRPASSTPSSASR